MTSTSKKNNDQELVDLQRAMLSGPTVGVPHAEGNTDTVRAYLARRAEQREVYGQFVATEDIYEPGGSALTFTNGMPVPIEHVEKWDLETAGMVERVASQDDARRGAALNVIGPASLVADDASTTAPAGGTSAATTTKPKN